MRQAIYEIYRAAVVIGGALRWSAVPFIRFVARRRMESAYLGRQLRRAMEDMGVAFHKVGQYLAMRFDILPPEVCEELGRLFEESTPMPPALARRLIEAELGRPLRDVFTAFDDEPLGAASLAQVHHAVTVDGVEVAIKIQKPGVERVFLADMRNLHRVASLADRMGLSGTISLRHVIEEVRDFTLREMDFLMEAETARRLRRQRLGRAYVPRIYHELCTRRLLVLEYIEGISLQELCSLYDQGRVEAAREMLPGVDVSQVVADLTHACLTQIYVSGFFHGDPHPGNILVRRDGTVVFIDFGIFGTLAPYERELYTSYVENLIRGDLEESFRSYARLSPPAPDTDVLAYKRSITSVMKRWYETVKDPGSTREERHTGKYQGEIVRIMRRHRVPIGRDQLLFWRVMVVLDATALRVPVAFNLLETLGSFFRRVRPPEIERFVDELLQPQARLQDVTSFGTLPLQLHRLIQRTSEKDTRPVVRRQSMSAVPRRRRALVGAIAAAVVGSSLAFVAAGLNGEHAPAVYATACLLLLFAGVQLIRT